MLFLWPNLAIGAVLVVAGIYFWPVEVLGSMYFVFYLSVIIIVIVTLAQVTRAQFSTGQRDSW